MGSFKSDGGFLARAEAARGSDSGSVRDQFSRLEVGGGSFKLENNQAAAAGGGGSGDRDWMNFASTQSQARMPV
jgi:hypothetical protein